MSDEQRWIEDASDKVKRELANARDALEETRRNARKLREEYMQQQRKWRVRNPNAWGAVCLAVGFVAGLMAGSQVAKAADGDVDYLMARVYLLGDVIHVCAPNVDGTMACTPVQVIAPPRHCRDEGVGLPMTCSPPGGQLMPERPA